MRSAIEMDTYNAIPMPRIQEDPRKNCWLAVYSQFLVPVVSKKRNDVYRTRSCKISVRLNSF